MSADRLGGAGVQVMQYLSSATWSDNPMRTRVHLHMYRIELDSQPELDPEYYVDSAWLTPDEYAARATGATCGLCMRMWSDYSVRRGIAAKPFAPPVPVDA